jgi:hypothetical protein
VNDEPIIPEWWAKAWAKMLARYPGCNVLAESGVVYFEDLCHYPEQVVLDGLDDARRASPTFFPSAQIAEEHCKKAYERFLEQRKSKALVSSPIADAKKYDRHLAVIRMLQELMNAGRRDLLDQCENDAAIERVYREWKGLET